MSSIANTKTKKRLQEIVKDIDALPKTDFLARHYLLHSSDLAILLHLCIRNLKIEQKLPDTSHQQENNEDQEQLGQGNQIERQMTTKDYNKQILEILRNKNKLTEEEQIDLINNVITTMNREKELEQTRKIYSPANHDFITGGGNTNSVDSNAIANNSNIEGSNNNNNNNNNNPNNNNPNNNKNKNKLNHDNSANLKSRFKTRLFETRFYQSAALEFFTAFSKFFNISPSP